MSLTLRHSPALAPPNVTNPDALSAAVAAEATIVHFQPIIDLRSGLIAAYEALLRVRSRTGEWVSPTGVLAEVDGMPATPRLSLHRSILARVLSSANEVERDSGRAVAVNLPATLLEDPSTVAMLSRRDGAGIILEILETTAIKNLPLVRRSMAVLRGLGYRVAIDDYGTGYSTAALLATLPTVDLVKIDLVFATTERGRAMLPELCRVVRAAQARVVIEGIENAESDELARAAGADFGQGYFYGFPAPYVPTTTTVGSAPILMGTTRNAPTEVR